MNLVIGHELVLILGNNGDDFYQALTTIGCLDKLMLGGVTLL